MLYKQKYLHLACMLCLYFEKKRKRLIDSGKFDIAYKTYRIQKINLPGFNSSNFWDKKFSSLYPSSPMEDWRIRKISDFVKNRKKILNLGVGRGKLEEKIKDIDKKEYVGTDITTETIRFLEKKFPKVKFRKEKLDNLSFPDNSFNVVILSEVLEHIRPDQTFSVLSEVWRVLKKNGYFLVSAPINEGLEKKLPLNPNSHKRLYSEYLLIFELLSSNFTIKKIHRVSAFSTHFFIKNFLNDLFHIRERNNLLVICQKK